MKKIIKQSEKPQIFSILNIFSTIFKILLIMVIFTSCGLKKHKKSDIKLRCDGNKSYPLSEFKYISFLELTFTQPSNKEYEYINKYALKFSKNLLDTIIVLKNSKPICNFLCKFQSTDGLKEIIGDKIVIKNEKGSIIQIDSIVPFDSYIHERKKEYFNAYFAIPVWERTYFGNGLPKNIKIKNSILNDSITLDFFDNGILNEERHHGSSLKKYYKTGVLKYFEDNYAKCHYDSLGRLEKVISNKKITYYQNGIISKILLDTIILNNDIQLEKMYYDNGVLKRIAYYSGQKPVGTWEYFNFKGILIKSEIKSKIIKTQGKIPKELIEDVRIYEYINRKPFNGERELELQAFIKNIYLSETNICKLKGRYVISFKVDSLGKANDIKLFGLNKYLIDNLIVNEIEKYIRWGRYWKKERYIDCEYEIQFYID